MESIEKLREYEHDCCARVDDTIHDLADEIEREIAERYMLLPLLAGGLFVLWTCARVVGCGLGIV